MAQQQGESNAGRVSLVPAGVYNAARTYRPLDLVSYSDASWVCRQECVGITPTDAAGQYWQHFGAAVGIADIYTAGIVRPDGTTVTIQEDGTISIPKAEATKLGLVQPDDVTIKADNNGVISVPDASSDTKGVVKIDNNTIKVGENGEIKVPKASDTQLGAVKVDGTSIQINENGVISSTGGKRLAAQTLAAGATTLVFMDADILTTSTIGMYANEYGVAPTNVVVTSGQVVLTFNAQQSALSVYITVS